MKVSAVLVSVAAVVALTACGGGDETTTEPGAASKTSVEPTPIVEADARYGSVDELREAAIKAGMPCPSWQQTNKITLAAESGECDDSTVLSTYASQGDLDSQVATTRELNETFEEMDIENDPVLVGPNWIINAPSALAIQDNLGGTLLQ